MDPNPLTQEKTRHTVFSAATADVETPTPRPSTRRRSASFSTRPGADLSEEGHGDLAYHQMGGA